MRKIKFIISILTIIAVIFSVCAISVSAAETTLHFSASSVEIGSTVTVTVNMQPSSSMLAVSCVVNYDQGVLKYVSGATSGGAGSLNIVLDDETGTGKDKFSATLTFTTIAVGSSTVSVKYCVYTYQPQGQLSQEKGFTGASASVTVTDKVLSSNADLKKLSLSKGSLSPKFSATTTSYTASVPYETTKCSIYATASDSGAKVAGSGVKTLQVGDNSYDVTVTAPSGAQKTYKIVIKRLEQTATSSDTNTSSDSDTTDDTQQADPYEAVIDGSSYTVATDISSVKLLSGFTATTADYNGTTVAAAVDSKNEFTLFYLTAPDSTELVPYIYNSSKNTFERLDYITQGEYDYIIADLPENYTFPDNFYSTNTKIGEKSYKSFGIKAEDMTDFSYFYCYVNGKYGVYRYDSSENVLQRCPEVELVSNVALQTNGKGFFARFGMLSANGKVIVVGLAVLALGAVALIVLFVVHLCKKKENLESDDAEEELTFDDVSVEEGFTYTAEEETVSAEDSENQ